ncbi:MAG: hypothetical protein M3032_07925 [Verrucomicrobiota bacterium]|nr:hypothetical protein [Verrucomicrobiota bacterium]
MRGLKFIAGSGAIVAATLGAASLIASLPAQVSFCSICGAREETRAYAIRFTAREIFRRNEIAATDFSALLREKNLVLPHAHDWRAPRYVADPMDQFSAPVLESLDYLNAPRVVSFTRNVADYADPLSVARWRELVVRPGYARLLDGTLRFLHVPPEGFAERAEFLAWWGRNSFAVYNRLREQTEPD